MFSVLDLQPIRRALQVLSADSALRWVVPTGVLAQGPPGGRSGWGRFPRCVPSVSGCFPYPCPNFLRRAPRAFKDLQLPVLCEPYRPQNIMVLPHTKRTPIFQGWGQCPLTFWGSGHTPSLGQQGLTRLQVTHTHMHTHTHTLSRTHTLTAYSSQEPPLTSQPKDLLRSQDRPLVRRGLGID